MKISKKILFSTFLIIGISSTVVFGSSGKVKIEATRIREEANTTSNIITVIYENDEVEILEESGDWYKIKYKDNTGYVKKEYITLDSSSSNTVNQTSTNQISSDASSNTSGSNAVSDDSATTAQDSQTVVIASETYAKLLPNFSSVNIVKFETSKELTKISEINNWIQVSDGQNTGWILKNKIQSKNQTVVEENQNTAVENGANVVANETTNTVSNTINSVTNTVTNATANNATSNTTNTSDSSTTSVNKKATVTVETAKVREKASTDSEVLGFLDYGDEITLLEKTGDWYKINFESKTGYIKSTLIKVSDETVSSRSLTEERESNETEEVQETAQNVTNSSDVVNYAMQYLGYPYVVGGKNPNTGFDCSGFTRYVFLNFGYSLGSTAASQNNIGDEISRSDLEQGDLILFLNEAKTVIGHTGIYIGDGNFIHAANPDRGVVTDNLNTNSYYNERFVTARRIVK